MSCIDSITYSMDMNLSKLWEIMKDREAWRAAVHRVGEIRTWFNEHNPSMWQLYNKHVLNELIKSTLYRSIVVQLLNHLWFFETPWTAVCQASLSFIISQSLLKLMSIELAMPSNHLILCRPLLLLPSIFSQHQGLFQWVSSLHQVAKALEFRLQHQSFQWIFRVSFL